MEQQQITAVLIMDLLVAFNTVDYDLLLDVLPGKFGITNTVLKWCKNYHIPRKFQSLYQWLILMRRDHGLQLTQGSTQGEYLFKCCASTLSKIVPDSLTLNSFIYDHSIRGTIKPKKRNTNKDNKASSDDHTITIMERSM